MLEHGLYEQVLNKLFEDKIAEVDRERYYIGERQISKEEVARLLSTYLTAIFEQHLSNISNLSYSKEDVSKEIEIANSIIKKLVKEFHLDDGNLISAQAKILTAVIDKTQSSYPDIAERLKEIRPLKGLTQGALFTGKGGISLYSELQKEIASADEIYLMVSFIKKKGIRLIWEQLKEFTDNGGKLKVITTTYMQATDFEAIKLLAKLKNTEIKITYDNSSERLHAKAYIFIRKTNFNTAYVGSSNLSRQALDTGAEWNIKITEVEQPRMMETIRNAFKASWNADGYETFINGDDDEKLKNALGQSTDNNIDFTILGLIRPFDYQQEILERLKVEREVRNHWRNLVVAATGTGKTVIAASDYKNFRDTQDRARLLFIAHREEILKQSHKTFQHVLLDYNFGEPWYAGQKPASYEYVFASKDTLNNQLSDLQLPKDYYDFIIIDEVHHIAAATYRKIIEHFKPKVLLGLTATPERMDGADITKDFDGTISAEIRLDDALNKGLLAPFHYYGISDSVDYTDVKWERGHYDVGELSRIYTSNDARTAVILKSLEKYLTNVRDVRALCFCADQEHAKYMQAKFTLCGLKSQYLTSENSQMRTTYYNQLKRKDINYLFVVDMFNEGIDIPEVDTILFLRPTESLTIFIQQFGRGLRKSEGKTHVNILDYVGNCRAEFNYSDRMRVILGRTSMSTEEEIHLDCPHLPFGCQVMLEPKAKEYIIKNIKGAVNRFSSRKIEQLVSRFNKDYSVDLTLSNFVNIHQIPLEKLYKNSTWNQLLHECKITENKSAFNEELKRAVYRKWLATDSYSYMSFIAELANKSFNVQVDSLGFVEQKWLLMLYYDLFENAGLFENLQDMLDALAADEPFCNEMRAVMPLLLKGQNSYEKPDNSNLSEFPLKLHGVYTKAQIQVAIGTSTLNHKSSSREGVERNKNLNVEAMYVDIIKDREIGSSTDYDDTALTPDLFQWDTQNRVRPDSNEGKAYIEKKHTMLLFVREQKTFPEDKYRTMGYVYLGRVELNSWEYKNLGSRMQMQIIWKMLEAIPGSVMHYARIKEIA